MRRSTANPDLRRRLRAMAVGASCLAVGVALMVVVTLWPRGDAPARSDGWRLEAADARASCVPEDPDVVLRSTPSGMPFVRTPDDRFAELPGWPFEPHYALIDGLRMHYVDEGPRDGEVILLLHGQPSWSYLYRRMIPPLAAEGHRVIAVDLMGLGRSDKPVELGVHTYEQHVAWVKQFLGALSLKEITLFAQDWGSLIGLRVAGDRPDLFARIVVANGTLPVIPEGRNPFRVPNPVAIDCGKSDFPFGQGGAGLAKLPDGVRRVVHMLGFQRWIEYALEAPALTPSEIVEALTVRSLTPAEAAAYDAPYPSLVYKAAIRTLPSMIAAIEEQSAPAWEALGRYERPFLFLGGGRDPNLGSPRNQLMWTRQVPGAKGQPHARFDAHHFIQEDIGETLAQHVAEFVRATPPAARAVADVSARGATR